jgi:putative tricarboxylic transport membrane protein
VTDVADRIDPEPARMTEHHASDPAPEGVRGRRIARWAAVAVLVAVSAVAMVLSVGYGLGSGVRPGPGLWPFIASVVMLGSTVVVAITDTLEDYEPWGTEAGRTIVAVASLAVFALLFTLLGFTVPAALLMLLWLRLFGRMRWVTAVPLAAAGAVALFLLFDVVLGVPLPRDVLMTPLTSWM